MHFVHIFDVYSTVIYRLDALVPRLDVTAVISYNNGYNGQKSILQKGSYNIIKIFKYIQIALK